MKKLLSGLFVLLGVVAFTASSSNAASIYYSIPLWGDTQGAGTNMRTTISVVSLGDPTNKLFQSTGATVKISLYNNVITKGTATGWTSISVTGTGSLWATLNKTFTSDAQSFLADTQNTGTTTTKWATSSGWASGTTDWGFGIIEVTSSGSVAPRTGDFAIQGFFYNNSIAGFPITISNY